MSEQLAELLRSISYTGMSATLGKEVDAVLTQLTDYHNPLRMNVPRKTGSGDAYTAPLGSDPQLQIELYRENPTLYDAWCAGYLDGDGSFIISRRWSTHDRKVPNFSYHPRATFACDDKKKYAIQQYLRARVVNHGAHFDEGDCSVYLSCFADILKLIERVKPYLVLKGKQAQLLEGFVSNKGQGHLKQRREDYEKMKALNHADVGNSELRCERLYGLAWLAGFIDADGCYHTGRTGTRLQIVNTRLSAMKVVEQLLKDLDIQYSKYSYTPKGHKLAYSIYVYGVQVGKLLAILIPFQISRKPAAMQCLSYLFNRKTISVESIRSNLDKLIKNVMCSELHSNMQRQAEMSCPLSKSA